MNLNFVRCTVLYECLDEPITGFANYISKSFEKLLKYNDLIFYSTSFFAEGFILFLYIQSHVKDLTIAIDLCIAVYLSFTVGYIVSLSRCCLLMIKILHLASLEQNK